MKFRYRLPKNIGDDKINFVDLNDLQSFSPPLRIKEIKNIFITKSGLVFNNFKLVQESIPHYKGRRSHFYKYAIGNYLLKSKKKLKGKYVLIHNHWCPGYYHWITEALPRFMAVKPHLSDRKILLPSTYKGYPLESLKMLGAKNFEFIDNNVYVEDLLIPENTHYTGHYDIVNVLDVRKTILDNIVSKNREHARIYISRNKAARRKIVNEVDLIPILKEYNFIILETEELSFEQQVQQFSSTDILISIHGAGLTNLLFMPENSTVVEVQMEPHEGKYNLLYLKLANLLNIDFNLMEGKIKGTKKSLYESDLEVDTDAFERLLKKICK